MTEILIITGIGIGGGLVGYLTSLWLQMMIRVCTIAYYKAKYDALEEIRKLTEKNNHEQER